MLTRRPGLCAIAIAVTTALNAACGSPTTPSRASLSVTSVTPSSGSTTGDTDVTISGSGFASDATVMVGGVIASRVTVQSATTLLVTVAAGRAGSADVVVTSGGRNASLAAGFTFIAPGGTNRPPAIVSLQIIGSRRNQPSGFADLGETLTLNATVIDAETPASSLGYAWSGPGMFSGSGASVSWRAPDTLPSTPSTVAISLAVTERFQEGGVTHTNTVTRAFPMRVHDSQREILDLGEDFLTLFSRSEVPTNQVLHNFSTTCDGGDGRRAEASDTDQARLKYRQDFSRFRITRNPPVTFNFAGACVAFGARIRPADACSLFTVHWEFTYLVAEDGHRPGDHGVTDGLDHVTAVLEDGDWKLCHSDFQ